jgi:hypothetical protein
MNDAPRYRLTEEVVRQAVEVIFRRDERWEIAFTNPTAGPWKKIRFGRYETGKELRFLKEEDRPDLILLNRTQRVLLVIEAKDSIGKLLISNRSGVEQVYTQLEKSVKVFLKELRRFDNIITNPDTAALIFGQELDTTRYTGVCGYLYTMGIQGQDDSRLRLNEAHTVIAATKGDDRLLPYVEIIVSQDLDTMNLSARVTLMNVTAELLSTLETALPPDLTIDLNG